MAKAGSTTRGIMNKNQKKMLGALGYGDTPAKSAGKRKAKKKKSSKKKKR